MLPIEQAAERLRAAYTEGAIAPLRDVLAPDDAQGAYAVQQCNTARWIDAGRRIVGRKIGLTAKAVQVQLGVDQPDYGVLFEDMALANDGVLAMNRMLQPKAEAEVAIILAHDVTDAECTQDTIAAAVDYVVAAIEIVDSRIADWKITFADTVADNGSSAMFVLGDDRHPLKELDLYTCGMVLTVDGAIASIGAGAACLGHPLAAAAWLARTMAAAGTPLRRGDVVLTGALGPMVPIVSGNRIEAIIGGLGRVGFTCGSGT